MQESIAPLYRRLKVESTPLGVSEVVIDLRQVRFMGPYAVLGLLVLAEGLNLIFQKRVKVLLPSYPEAPDCILWIAQSGFLEAIAPWADLEPLPLSGILPVRDDSSIIPVRVVETRKHYLDLVEELLEKIPVQLGSSLTTEECLRVVTMVSELCQNCLYFGKNEDEEVRAYAMFQAFRGTVKFAVADTGPGIPLTLKRKYHAQITPWHDSLAIALAMKRGVTTREGGGGLGLFHVNDLVGKQNGILNIRSGTGKVLLCRGQEFPYLPGGIYRGPMYFWGTQVGIVLERR